MFAGSLQITLFLFCKVFHEEKMTAPHLRILNTQRHCRKPWSRSPDLSKNPTGYLWRDSLNPLWSSPTQTLSLSHAMLSWGTLSWWTIIKRKWRKESGDDFVQRHNWWEKVSGRICGGSWLRFSQHWTADVCIPWPMAYGHHYLPVRGSHSHIWHDVVCILSVPETKLY